jgi:ATP-dependent DNA ligase
VKNKIQINKVGNNLFALIHNEKSGVFESVFIEPTFEGYTTKEHYEKAGIKGYEPMTAKEIETEEQQDELFNDPNIYAEEKFDGTRALLYVLPKYLRFFSRRISKKTGFYCENTDSLPHLKYLDIPELKGTILDGEMFIPNRLFKTVSGIMNCKWDEAIERQMKQGFVVFHAFDILFYKGIDLRKVKLKDRKRFLQYAVDRIDSPYVKMVNYSDQFVKVTLSHDELGKLCRDKELYPTLYAELEDSENEGSLYDYISKKAYYEYVVFKGGEGVILKRKDGQYFHKRGREYQKVKKFMTREVIILGFNEPTKEYKGKFPNDRWEYWTTKNSVRIGDKKILNVSAKQLVKDGYIPVSKFWYKDWVGNIRFGVNITDEEIVKLPKGKKFNIEKVVLMNRTYAIIEVGECSGYNEEQRGHFSNNRNEWVGEVIEIKCNEIFKDTGKMRHPRFLRERPDKLYTMCTWKEHIGEED